MYFVKNELIELNNGEKYLVLDTALLDDVAYYKIELIEEDKKTGNIKYISAKNKEGKLYIEENIAEDVLNKLHEILDN